MHGIAIGDDLLLASSPLAFRKKPGCGGKLIGASTPLGSVLSLIPGLSGSYETWDAPQRRSNGAMGAWEKEPVQKSILFSTTWELGPGNSRHGPSVTWGNYFVRDGDTVYIYGTRALPDAGGLPQHEVVVARVRNVETAADLPSTSASTCCST